MTSIVDGAIGRARMVLAILICAVIAGTVTYVKLPKEALKADAGNGFRG